MGSYDAKPSEARLNELPRRLVVIGLSFPLIGGKWGSYIGLPSRSLFLSDLFVIVGIVGLLVWRKGPQERSGGSHNLALLVLLPLGLFAAIEFLLGQGSFLLRLRDLLPFFDLLLIPALTEIVRREGGLRLFRFLWLTSLAHAIWAIPALLGALGPKQLPPRFFGFPVFTPRPDIDVPLLALFIVLLLAHCRWPDWLRFGLICLTIFAMLGQSSRASLAGAFLGVVVFCWLERTRLRALIGRTTFLIGGAALLAGIVALSSPAMVLSSGALGRAGLVTSAASQGQAASGAGTARGREDAWRLVLGYWRVNGSPTLGLKPGTEILRDSGAVMFLSGDDRVRAPHNWWVDCLVRFGPIGLLLYVYALWMLTRVAYVSANGYGDRISIVQRHAAVGLLTAILVAASVGVVIESPFGGYVLVLCVAIIRSAPRESRLPLRPFDRYPKDYASQHLARATPQRT